MTPSLNAARRATELTRLAEGEPVDVVVVGGGITGAGVALDAASRGLSVALLERRDLAHGTRAGARSSFTAGCATSPRATSRSPGSPRSSATG